MTFDINTADGTFTVKVDGKNESTITFTNTFTYKTVSPGGGGNGGSTTTDTTKNDGKKVGVRQDLRRWYCYVRWPVRPVCDRRRAGDRQEEGALLSFSFPLTH